MDDQAMENVPEDDDTGECCLYLVYLHVDLYKVLIQITICLLQVKKWKKWMTKQWKMFQKTMIPVSVACISYTFMLAYIKY